MDRKVPEEEESKDRFLENAKDCERAAAMS